MKARIDAILQRNQAEYLEQLIPQTDPLLQEMEEYGGEHGVPSADREVALFVEITARESTRNEPSRLAWLSATRLPISRGQSATAGLL